MKILFTLIVVSLLGACSLMSQKPVDQASVSISIENQDRILFSGKGAGAGMMMSASMGAMGIAIGVAIDEGIAKEVHESFVSLGNDFSEMIKTETNFWLANVCNANQATSEAICQPNLNLIIKVYRYGFVTTSGDNDPVKPELDIGFVLNTGEEHCLNLKSVEEASKAPLEIVKKDGKVTSELLTKSYQLILENYAISLSN